MADVQPENGYTRIANEILEQVAKRKFNGTQLNILLTLWRQTYGFQRKSCELSLSFIAEAISADKHQVKRELNKLIEWNVVLVHSKPDFNATRKLGFNKDFDTWEKDHSVLIRPLSAKKTTGSELDHETVGGLAHSPVGELDHQEINIKEIKISSTTTDPVEKVFKAYLRIHDKVEHHNYGQYALIEKKINEGYEPDMIIQIMEEKNNGNVNSFNFYNNILLERKNKGPEPIDTKSLVGEEWARTVGKAAGFGGGT